MPPQAYKKQNVEMAEDLRMLCNFPESAGNIPLGLRDRTTYIYTIMCKLTTIEKKSKVCNMSIATEVLFITQAGCSL